MNILILGGGGREHAIAWAVAQNPKCGGLFCAPGNAGIAEVATCLPCDIESAAAVVALVQDHAIDFVIIGPEAPLAAGVSDALRAMGVLTFGPSQAAAQLEASKAFTKSICDAADAPTAAYAHFTHLDDALAYVDTQPLPLVIKADGLAAGKGVVIAETKDQAAGALADMFGGAFGAAGAEVVIEAFLKGEEASFFVLVDGETLLPIGTAQDHKRIGEGDTGPNTGGMGAYSPAPVLTDDIAQKALDQIIRPTMREMAQRGTPYQGVLYAGLMIDDGNPSLVEYNVRFGDPECQVLMMRLGGQALDVLQACAEGALETAKVTWADDHAMTVVLAAKGYPGAYEKGSIIKGLPALPSTTKETCFHAGTKLDGSTLTAVGGRVLNVTGRGATLQEAASRAYGQIPAIDWPEGIYRQDIGWRALP